MGGIPTQEVLCVLLYSNLNTHRIKHIIMNQEIWKDIPEFKGIYQVSNLGNVKGLDRKFFSKHNGVYSHIKGRLMTKLKTSNGYVRVSLSKDGKTKMYLVHRLMAKAFLDKGITGKRIVVDHINGVRDDNRLENLQIIHTRLNTTKDQKNKTSKYPGVSKHGNGWVTKAFFDKKLRYIGYFKTELEAFNAYKNFLKKNDPEFYDTYYKTVKDE